MTNIWSFAMQTIEASMIAILVLLVRLLLKNSISPKLMYCLWFILFVRILFPAGIFYKYMVPRLAIMLETIKSMVESSLNSSYISQYSPVKVSHSLPWLVATPSSITDWLFVIYISGVIAFFIIYTCLCVRRMTHLTHSGSRLAYGIQLLFWSILRSLNWCNPFLQYVFWLIFKDLDFIYDNKEHGIQGNSQNLSLLYICIMAVLLVPSVSGISTPGLYEVKSGRWSLPQALSSARISRCTTVAGAIDTYAKAIMYSNEIYLLAASPIDMQKEIIEGAVYPLTYDVSGINQQYEVYNLQKNIDGTYSALIVFKSNKLLGENGDYLTYTDNSGNIKYCYGYYIHPVKVEKKTGWVISQAGNRQISAIDPKLQNINSSCIPYLNTYEAECNTGIITIHEQSIYKVNITLADNHQLLPILSGISYDRTAKLDAEFDSVDTQITYSYKYTGTEADRKNMYSAGLAIIAAYPGEDIPEFKEGSMDSDILGGSINGYNYIKRSTRADWDGVVTGYFDTQRELHKKNLFPDYYKVRLYLTNKPIDTVTITRGEGK